MQNIPFQITAIELLDLSLNAPKEQLEKNVVYKYDINLQHRLNLENNYIIVLTTVKILNEEKDHVGGQLRASCIFSVENLNDYVDPVTKSMNMPQEFIENINSEAISTTRGIMYNAFRGTYLHNAIIPVIDPKNFGKQ